jgi:hypothetical protein
VVSAAIRAAGQVIRRAAGPVIRRGRQTLPIRAHLTPVRGCPYRCALPFSAVVACPCTDRCLTARSDVQRTSGAGDADLNLWSPAAGYDLVEFS